MTESDKRTCILARESLEKFRQERGLSMQELADVVGRDIKTMRRVFGMRPTYISTARAVAEALNVDLDTMWRWQAEMEGAVHIPLDRTASDRDSTAPAISEFLTGEDEEAPDDRMSREQEVVLLREAILVLKDQERTVLSLYYFEELKLHEIATILSLTESRVSQIRSKALIHLREKLAPMRATA